MTEKQQQQQKEQQQKKQSTEPQVKAHFSLEFINRVILMQIIIIIGSIDASNLMLKSLLQSVWESMSLHSVIQLLSY